ncbi:unnamed protein product [Mesocestoides corti]|uniref:Usp domain-containing protein n=1 Tax=Mesocestoides corti TaxID=53468 RepID=A0A0R3U8N1_MESCO|nr:unnamed protein product [Mesocestoides corti]
MGRKYLLPIDPSENCRRAVKFYNENLRREDDSLVFLHVVEPNFKSPTVNISTDTDPSVRDMSTQMESAVAAGKMLGHKYLSWGREEGITCKALVHVDSKPGVAILKVAKENKVDHIIVASRGLNALGRTLLGSVSSYVVHHATVPVTVVPCPEDEKPSGTVRRFSLY